MQLRPIAVLFLMLFFSLYGAGQNRCKPTLKENRGKVMVLGDIRSEVLKWQDPTQSNRRITAYELTDHDSVLIHQNGRLIGSFPAKHGRISSPRLVLTDEQGRLQSIDSFPEPSRMRDFTDYFGDFWAITSSHWEFHTNGMPSKVIYTGSYGEDSLTIYWSETGIIRHKKDVHAEYTYTPEGTLISKRGTGDLPYLLEFYPDGVLRAASIDTLILHQRVEWKRAFSPKGILLQEQWYKNGQPRGTWYTYNDKGILVKTVKHAPLVREAVIPEVVEAAREEEILMYVEEQAEFPGGPRALKQFLEPRLSAIFCQSNVLVSGTYLIRFQVGEQGKVYFDSLEGVNAAALEQAVKECVEQMPKWKSARRFGRPALEGFAVPVEIRL